MATGLRTWLAVLAGGTAAVALLGLPPRDGTSPPPGATEARRAHARDLRAELARLDDVLRRTRVADSLRTVIADLAGSPTGMTVGHPPGWEPSTRSRVVERRLSDEVGALPDRDGAVLLGAFWVPATQGGHPGVDPPPRPASPEWYGGELPDGGSYCAVVLPVLERGRRESAALEPALDGHRLGPCAWWGRFGAPGPAVERWLAAGAVQYTVRRRLRQDDLWYLEETARGVFGGPDQALAMNGPLRRCLDGVTPVCTALLTAGPGDAGLDGPARAAPVWLQGADPGPRTQGYLGQLWRWPATLPMGVPSPVLLADLEREFGTGAVRAFWTSDEPVGRAFRTAFGTDAGSWTHRWLAGYYARARWALDPLPALPATLSVAALLAVAAAMAGGVSRRRRLG